MVLAVATIESDDEVDFAQSDDEAAPLACELDGVADARPLSRGPSMTRTAGADDDDASIPEVVGVPRLVPTLRRGVAAIAAGGSHTLALLGDGVTIVACGRGASGGGCVASPAGHDR